MEAKRDIKSRNVNVFRDLRLLNKLDEEINVDLLLFLLIITRFLNLLITTESQLAELALPLPIITHLILTLIVHNTITNHKRKVGEQSQAGFPFKRRPPPSKWLVY